MYKYDKVMLVAGIIQLIIGGILLLTLHPSIPWKLYPLGAILIISGYFYVLGGETPAQIK